MPPKDRLLTQAEVAQALGVSEAWLERKRCTGGGPRHLKLGTGKYAPVRYRQSDIEGYLEGCVRCSTSDPGPA